MYQCNFFYQQAEETTELHPFVLSAWSVLADQFYHYHTDGEKETAFYPEDSYAFIRTLDGSGSIVTEDGLITLPKNEYIVLKLNHILHYASLSNVWQYHWVNFTCPEQERNRLSQIHGNVANSDKERNLFQELLEAGTGADKTSAYVNAVFAHYFYVVTARTAKESQTVKPLQIEEICCYIDQKYYSRLKVSTIAEFFNISTRRLNQIFHEQYHISPKKYIQNLKIEKAKTLLTHTACNVSEIATMLSFDSTYHFSSEFKKSTGVPPTVYRRENANKT